MTIRQLPWLRLAGDDSKGSGKWKDIGQKEKLQGGLTSYMRTQQTSLWPLTLSPLQFRISSQSTKILPEFPQMQSLPESFPGSALTAYDFSLTSRTLSHSFSDHFLPYIRYVWVHALRYPLLVGISLRPSPRLTHPVLPSPSPFSAQYSAGAQHQRCSVRVCSI